MTFFKKQKTKNKNGCSVLLDVLICDQQLIFYEEKKTFFWESDKAEKAEADSQI